MALAGLIGATILGIMELFLTFFSTVNASELKTLGIDSDIIDFNVNKKGKSLKSLTDKFADTSTNLSFVALFIESIEIILGAIHLILSKKISLLIEVLIVALVNGTDAILEFIVFTNSLAQENEAKDTIASLCE